MPRVLPSRSQAHLPKGHPLHSAVWVSDKVTQMQGQARGMRVARTDHDRLGRMLGLLTCDMTIHPLRPRQKRRHRPLRRSLSSRRGVLCRLVLA